MADEEWQKAASDAGWVPPKRLSEITAERQRAQDAAAVATSEREKLAASLAEQSKIVESWNAKAIGWDEERAAYRVGITDDDGIAIARTLHASHGKGATFGDWLAGDGRKHKALSPYLAQQPAAAESAPPPAHVPPARPAGQPVPPASAQPASGEITAQAIREAREYGTRTGDWSKFKAITGRT